MRESAMASPIVVDLSHWNPTPDWKKLKADGCVGVIHKASEGTSYVDNMLFSRASAAIAAGLCWSTYHFLKAGNIQAQMDHYLKTVNPKQGERMCIDHEEKATLGELEAAVSYLHAKRPDVQVTVYSGHLIKEQLGSAFNATLAATSLWIAQYTTAAAPSWPSGTWPQWSLWQYTDKASAAGVSAPVDGNRWNGDPANLPLWFGPATVAPPVPEPEPTPTPATVSIAIAASPGTLISVTVNGVQYGVATVEEGTARRGEDL
jgi:lysozyme